MTAAERLAPPGALCETGALGMAEMGIAGLSEQWLMRRAGDLHWRLIARAMGQREAVFACAEGGPLYAAFCATRLTLDRPELPRLGGGIALAARLFRVGRGRLGSLVEIQCEGESVGWVALVSAFVGRGEGGGNRSLVRRNPRALAVPGDTMPELDALAARAARAAAMLRAARLPGPDTWLTPCPRLDFNAAGLLYFPSFAGLADRAEFARGSAADGLLLGRETYYFGNVDPGEPIGFHLAARPNARRAIATGRDGRPLAMLRSRWR